MQFIKLKPGFAVDSSNFIQPPLPAALYSVMLEEIIVTTTFLDLSKIAPTSPSELL